MQYASCFAALLAATAVELACHKSLAQPLASHRVDFGNGGGMDIHLFRPATDWNGFAMVNGAEPLRASDMSIGLVADYGHNLMRLDNSLIHGSAQLVTRSVQGTLSLSYGLGDAATVGLSATLDEITGDATKSIGPAGTPYDVPAFDALSLGSTAAHAKLALLRATFGLQISVLLRAGIGLSGDFSRDLGSDKVFYWPELLVEQRFRGTRRLRLGLNIGYRGHSQADPRFDQLAGRSTFAYANLFTGAAAISYEVVPSLAAMAETYFTEEVGGPSSGPAKWSQEATLGIKFFADPSSYLLIGAGTRITPGFEAADLRAFVGFVFRPISQDRDGDGIKDDVDLCPDQPEDFDGFQDQDGCPDPDNDNDGIPDVDDRCPNEPENFNGIQDQDGCPEIVSDRDGDGIVDACDKCPDEPEDKDGFEDMDGCPDPDNDRDGIADSRDQCPNDPENYNGFEDADGCPDTPSTPPKEASVSGNLIVIEEQIRFQTDSADILPQSETILTTVATTMKNHQEIVLVEIEGHADERAPDERNLDLTNQRASAVLEALVRLGVARERLRAMGFGSYCPLDRGHTEDAWTKNRRVEFKIVRTRVGETGVTLGCRRASENGVTSPPAR